MKTVYATVGVPAPSFVPDADQTYPAFEAVQDELCEDRDNQAPLGRMSPFRERQPRRGSRSSRHAEA